MSNQEVFFNSIKRALEEGTSQESGIVLVKLIGSGLLFSFLTIYLLHHRSSIRREITIWIKYLTGDADFADRRRRASYPVSIIVPMSSRPLERHRTVNISKGGMFIHTRRPFELKTSFQFILELNKTTLIKGTALVRWVKPSSDPDTPAGMGCEFIGLTEGEKNLIRLFLRSRKTRFFKG